MVQRLTISQGTTGRQRSIFSMARARIAAILWWRPETPCLLLLLTLSLTSCATPDPCAHLTHTRALLNNQRGFTGPELPHSRVMFHVGVEHGAQCRVVACSVLTNVGRGDGY